VALSFFSAFCLFWLKFIGVQTYIDARTDLLRKEEKRENQIVTYNALKSTVIRLSKRIRINGTYLNYIQVDIAMYHYHH
jgi:hypothetical protein